jgi:hypothetical protein
MYAAAVDQFEKIELLLDRPACARRRRSRPVGCAAVHVESDALHGFAGGNRLDLARNLRPAPLELRSKLRRNRIGALLIGLLERAPDGAVHRCRNDRDAEQHRRRKQQQKFLAEAHRDPAWARESVRHRPTKCRSSGEARGSIRQRTRFPVRARERRPHSRPANEKAGLRRIPRANRARLDTDRPRSSRRRRMRGCGNPSCRAASPSDVAGSGLGKHDAHQADVFRSRQRYLHGDADFARVERNAFGDQLGLRISRVVT